VVQGRGGNPHERSLDGLAGSPKEKLSQERNILAPLAERGQLEGHDIEPKEEIGAKPLGLHVLIQVPIRGGDDADVDLNASGAPDPFEVVPLEHPEQFGLEFRFISPISSKNTVPPLAISSFPSLT
jgi:hypothetical protein